jgi:hypothetical protein
LLPALRRARLTATYSSVMGIARRRSGPRHEPVRPPQDTARYEGLWVAVKDDRVIAAARTSRELVYELAKIGPDAKGATMQRVPSAERGLLVGLG